MVRTFLELKSQLSDKEERIDDYDRRLAQAAKEDPRAPLLEFDLPDHLASLAHCDAVIGWVESISLSPIRITFYRLFQAKYDVFTGR